MDQASRFARLALDGLAREYPNGSGNVLNGPNDLASPREMHPAFFGCFDWHSSVHSHWLLVHLLRVMPALPETAEIRQALGRSLTAENLLVEKAYFEAPNRLSFERMYGWAWLLKLSEELALLGDAEAVQWRRNLQPLTELIVARYLDFLPGQTYPIRSGAHPNTAFGLTLALDYAGSTGDGGLRKLLVARSRDYFAADVDYPAAWEPGGNEFLSPCLVEADLMRRVLPAGEFRWWLASFLPGLPAAEPRNLFSPALVSSHSDPQIVHLDGLNLSRAWCMYGVASVLPPDDPAASVLRVAAGLHAAAALPHVTSGDYMGEHWLASFAVYMLTGAGL